MPALGFLPLAIIPRFPPRPRRAFISEAFLQFYSAAIDRGRESRRAFGNFTDVSVTSPPLLQYPLTLAARAQHRP